MFSQRGLLTLTNAFQSQMLLGSSFDASHEPVLDKLKLDRPRLIEFEGCSPLTSSVRKVNPMEIIHLQVLPASRTFLLDLDGLLDAVRAEDMAAHGCGGLLQLVPTHRAGKDWFL